jgi:hypothetical protein
LRQRFPASQIDDDVADRLRAANKMISAGNLARLPVLDGVEHLIILVDHDASGTGQESADAYAERWVVAGWIVTRLVPDQVDSVRRQFAPVTQCFGLTAEQAKKVVPRCRVHSERSSTLCRSSAVGE